MVKTLLERVFDVLARLLQVGFLLVGLALGTHLIVIGGCAEGFFRLAGEPLRRVSKSVIRSGSGAAFL